MLIASAWAQEAGAVGPGAVGQLVPLLLIVLVFYFLLIRPQQKRLKEHNALIDSLKRGDKVITGGGIVGTISKVDEDEHIEVEIAKDVKVRVVRSTVTGLVSRK